MDRARLESDIRSRTDHTPGSLPLLSVSAVADLASAHKIPGHIVESTALSLGVIPARYRRNMDTISPEGQRKLLDARVALVGLGGLGGNVLDTLARAGVGAISGADGDRFEAGNLNRQLLATSATLGMPKAEAALSHVRAVNPSVSFTPVDRFLDGPGMSELLAGADLAVDCLGGLEHRLELEKRAAEAHIPLVTGALAGWTGYVSVILPGQAGPARLMGLDNGAEEQLGCPAPTVSTVAAAMCAQIISLLTNDHSTLQGNMLIIDLKDMTSERVLLS